MSTLKGNNHLKVAPNKTHSTKQPINIQSPNYLFLRNKKSSEKKLQ